MDMIEVLTDDNQCWAYPAADVTLVQRRADYMEEWQAQQAVWKAQRDAKDV